MADIAWALNRDDIPTRKGNQWTVWSISRLLHNPIYAGYMRWDGIVYPGEHNPIVSVSDFNSVQRLIASRIKDPELKKCSELPEEISLASGNDGIESGIIIG